MTPAGKRRLVDLLSAVCVLGILLSATCWHWNRQRADLLSTEQAVEAILMGQDATWAIQYRWKQAIQALRDAAERHDVAGQHARHALDVLKREIAR